MSERPDLDLNAAMFRDFEAWVAKHDLEIEQPSVRAIYLDAWEAGRRYENGRLAGINPAPIEKFEAWVDAATEAHNTGAKDAFDGHLKPPAPESRPAD